MLRKLILIVLIVVGLSGVGVGAIWFSSQNTAPPVASTDADPAHLQIGTAFLDDLDAGRYEAALARTTPRVQGALTGGKLQEIWEALPAQVGARQSRSPLRGEAIAGTPVVTSTLTFERAALDARIAVDAEGRIDGFRLVPAKLPAKPPAGDTAPGAPTPFVEREFPVGEAERPLGGTLTLPAGDGPFPVVLLAHGSGPHDRDETLGQNRPFRDIAHGLADHGIATLRYDKRTLVHPEDFASNDFTVDDETVNDAVLAIAQLRVTPEIDPQRIFLAGHSLGAQLAPRIAQRAQALAGLILLAAPARPLQEMVVEQLRYLVSLDDETAAAAQAQLAAISAQAAAVATLTADTPASDTLLGLPARYWIDLRDYDPVVAARALPQPMLVVQGGRDYQVTVEGDFARWREAFAGDPRVQLALHPDLDHLLIAGDGPSRPADYLVAGHVDEAVIAAMARFVLAGP